MQNYIFNLIPSLIGMNFRKIIVFLNYTFQEKYKFVKTCNDLGEVHYEPFKPSFLAKGLLLLADILKLILLFILISLITLFLFNFFSENAFAVNQYVKPGEDQLETVWVKVSQFFGGVGGKLASLGMIVASLLSKDRIGIPMMILGIIAGMMIPSLPAIIDNFTHNF